MRIAIALLATCLLMVLVLGCSEKQKDAAKLEQEMEDQMESAADTLTGEATAADTAVTPAPDAHAIPEEKQPPSASLVYSTPEGTGYTVQVASCEDPNYAAHLVDLYKERGYEVYVSSFSEMGQSYTRVRIGDFDSISGARKLQSELKDKYSIEGWVAPIGE